MYYVPEGNSNEKQIKSIYKFFNAIVFITMALFILSSCGRMISTPTNKLANKKLIIYNNNLGNIIKKFLIFLIIILDFTLAA